MHGIKFDNLVRDRTDTHHIIELDACYGDLTIGSGKIKVKFDYGTNPLQSAITIAENVAMKRLIKRLNQNASNSKE